MKKGKMSQKVWVKVRPRTFRRGELLSKEGNDDVNLTVKMIMS